MIRIGKWKLHFNAPVILGMTALSFALLILGMITGGRSSAALAVYRTSWADPMQYLRLFTHVVIHANMAHYTGNFLLILAVGPLVEEKYGSSTLLGMMGVTALVTGLVNVMFFPRVHLAGASGIVFMLILLASFTNIREGAIPVTVLLVGFLYIGNEIVTGLLSNDNISQLSHILGGLCGCGFGYLIHGSKIRRKPR